MPEALLFAVALSGLHLAALGVAWIGFAWMHERGFAARFRVAEGAAPDARLLRAAGREVLAGQPVFALLLYFVVHPLWRARGGGMGDGLDAVSLGWQLLAFFALNDTIFYWAHRLLHRRYLFQRVHHRHHRFRFVRVPVAEYAHPLENAVNFVAFFAGPVLVGCSFPVMCVWVVVRIFETVEAHSGYDFTRSGSRHAYHHLYAGRGCYGSAFGFWDRVMRTDRHWRAWRAGVTHR